MRDPLARKLFQSRDAREKLRGMGGIMASSPRLAETVAKFNLGGDVTVPVVGPSQEPARATYMGVDFAIFPDGRVVNTLSNQEVTEAQDPTGILRRTIQSLASGELAALDVPPDVAATLSPEEIEDIVGFEDITSPMRERFAETTPPFEDTGPSNVETFLAETLMPGRAAEMRARETAAGREPPAVTRQREAAEEAAAAEAEERTRVAAAEAEAQAAAEAEPPAEPVVTEDDPLKNAADTAAKEVRNTLNLDPPPAAPRNRRERVEQELELIREIFGDRTKEESRGRMGDLAMIGLAIAAGQSPDALTNIAQGILTGTQAMEKARAAERERDDALRMKAFENIMAEEADVRRLSRELQIAGVRAGAERSAFGTPTHPLNQWFTTRNQLDQQARDPNSGLWMDTQNMPEAERNAYLDNLALQRIVSGVGADSPEVQELIRSVESGSAGQAFAVQRRIDSLRQQNRSDDFIRDALRDAGLDPTLYGL